MNGFPHWRVPHRRGHISPVEHGLPGLEGILVTADLIEGGGGEKSVALQRRQEFSVCRKPARPGRFAEQMERSSTLGLGVEHLCGTVAVREAARVRLRGRCSGGGPFEPITNNGVHVGGRYIGSVQQLLFVTHANSLFRGAVEGQNSTRRSALGFARGREVSGRAHAAWPKPRRGRKGNGLREKSPASKFDPEVVPRFLPGPRRNG